jgi:hypothetical protein
MRRRLTRTMMGRRRRRSRRRDRHKRKRSRVSNSSKSWIGRRGRSRNGSKRMMRACDSDTGCGIHSGSCIGPDSSDNNTDPYTWACTVSTS